MPDVTGFTRPTLPQLIDRIQTDINARIPGADSRLRRSVLSVLAFVFAGAVHLLYGFVSFIAQQILPDTARVEFLERHAIIWNVPRKPATGATGNVTFSGVNATVIERGTVLRRADDVQFVTDAEATIAAGTAIVSVTAALAAADSETVSGTTLSLVSPIGGVQSAVIVGGGGLTGGADAEDVEAWRVRILDRIRQPPAGGNANDYEEWALQVPGVTRAWVFPLELGIGTVTVRFVRDNDVSIIPDNGEVAVVQAYIDARRPVTADVTVVAPVAVPQDFEITVAPDTTAIRASIEAELADLVAREGVPDGTLYLSRIREAISIAAGEFTHTLVAPAADVVLAQNEIGTMGIVTWT